MGEIGGEGQGLYAPRNMFSLFQLELHRDLHLVPGRDSWEQLHMELWHERNAVVFNKKRLIYSLLLILKMVTLSIKIFNPEARDFCRGHLKR
jgi:hypothetical protein